MTRNWRQGAAVLLSVCLAITVLPGKDIVLCIGENGHMALESAQNGRCDEGFCRPLQETPRPPQCHSNDGVCGDCISCVDIPLTQGPVAGPGDASSRVVKNCFNNTGSSDAALPAQREPFCSAAIFGCASLPPPDIGSAAPASPRILRI